MKRLWVLLALGAIAAGPRSGYDDASAETRAMQDDDSANPAFLWVREGEAQWSTPAGRDGKSCATCHGDAAVSMVGVAAHYPEFDAKLGRAFTLDQRIARCRTQYQQTDRIDPESDVSLGLSAYVGLQSRGRPVAVRTDGVAKDAYDAGKSMFETRMGQLNLSCAQCHDQRAGLKLAGAVIPEGHANGYPEYRLEWQSMGSFARRARNCMIGVRAEPLSHDSAELAALGLYLAKRAEGLKIETPAVRP